MQNSNQSTVPSRTLAVSDELTRGIGALPTERLKAVARNRLIGPTPTPMTRKRRADLIRMVCKLEVQRLISRTLMATIIDESELEQRR